MRWELYSKHKEDGDMLPPTAAALNFHIKRANYVSLMWKKSVLLVHPVLPDCSINQGWEDDDGDLVPIMTDNLPAPEMSL